MLGLAFSIVGAQATCEQNKNQAAPKKKATLTVQQRSENASESSSGLLDIEDVERSTYSDLSDHDKAIFAYADEAAKKHLNNDISGIIKALATFSSVVSGCAEKPKVVYSLVLHAFLDSMLEAKGDVKATHSLFANKIQGIEEAAAVYLAH